MTARYLYNNVYALLASCLLLCFTACSNESAVGGDDPDAPGQLVSLRLQIGTSMGTNALPQTKGSDNLAKDGEYISTLKVFITDASGGSVEKVVPFTFSAEQNEALKAGNLESCTSDEFTITTGTKRIYAFANYEKITELASISNDNLSLPPTITWDKGAGWRPSAETGFIPMSAMKEVTIKADNQPISIELVRLLSRLEVSFKNDTQNDINLTLWSIGNFNKKINLFEGGTILPIEDDNFYKIESNETKRIPTGEVPIGGDYYYVSESTMTGGFSVSITREGSPIVKPTVRNELPRNNVWPLEIVFSNYKLKIQIEGFNPPIGGYPDGMTDCTGSTECTIRGGGPFTLTPTLFDMSNNEMDGVTWEIDTSSSEENQLVKDLKVSEVNDNEITGVMKVPEESADNTYTFTLTAFKDGSSLASFTVTLKYKDIFEQ